MSSVCESERTGRVDGLLIEEWLPKAAAVDVGLSQRTAEVGGSRVMRPL